MLTVTAKLNGWDVDVLQKATDDCLDLSGVMESCRHFEFYSTAEAQQCKIQPSVDEQVTGILDALPGQNPVNEEYQPTPVKQNDNEHSKRHFSKHRHAAGRKRS